MGTVSPTARRGGRRTKVLVALDGSESSERVASFVNRFFAGVPSEVVGLGVTDEPRPLLPVDGSGAAYLWGNLNPTRGAGPVDDLRRSALDRAEEAVVRSGLTSAVAVGELGDPVNAVLRAADERDVDLIVVGSSHRRWLQRLFKRSVAKSIVRLSGRPVLVVP